MRSKLITTEQLQSELRRSEPSVGNPIAVRDEGATPTFQLEKGWADEFGKKTDNSEISGTIRLGLGSEFALTKGALLTATSEMGIPRNFFGRLPADMAAEIANYCYATNPDKKTLITRGQTAIAMSKGSIVSFSNLSLLDSVMAGITARGYKGEILVDYKRRHDPRTTAFRLVLPDMTSDVRTGDVWSYGIEVRNSLTGDAKVPTSTRGYAFRWLCTNGDTTQHGAGNWSRRHQGQDPAAVYEWARKSVDEALEGLEGEFQKLEAMAGESIKDSVNFEVRDVFANHNVPRASREAIMRELVEADDLTLYGLHAAVTAAANNADLTAGQVDNLLHIGGALTTQLSERCGECHQIRHI